MSQQCQCIAPSTKQRCKNKASVDSKYCYISSHQKCSDPWVELFPQSKPPSAPKPSKAPSAPKSLSPGKSPMTSPKKTFSPRKSPLAATKGKIMRTIINDVRRRFAIVPVPSHVRQYWHTKNILFFESSGTSNTAGYGSVFFPSEGVGESGKWVIKFADKSAAMRSWANTFCSIFDEYLRDIGHLDEFITPKGRRPGFYNLDLSDRLFECKAKFEGIFKYFPHWWMLQISAALGGVFWERPDMKYLRDFALNFSWDYDKREFVEDSNIINEYTFTNEPLVADNLLVMRDWAADNDALDKAYLSKKWILMYNMDEIDPYQLKSSPRKTP